MYRFFYTAFKNNLQYDYETTRFDYFFFFVNCFCNTAKNASPFKQVIVKLFVYQYYNVFYCLYFDY